MLEAREISKSYNVDTPSTSLREAFERLPDRIFFSGREERKRLFWAVRNVSFTVRQGEAIGLIGRNGAGKSTLLKILSRITEPTSGEVDLYGQTASLLEIGTGFHPDFSGRENILLNGVLLGMSRREMRTRANEIAAFAELTDFMDTPVKYYSSGMYVRLAFAIAANLEPEVLILDEVLAVGDIEFQQKCFTKMDELRKHGCTIIFASHDLGSVKRVCDRALLMDGGRLIDSSHPEQVIESYLELLREQSHSAVC
ncbi:MAG: ABC transporter ATP-binding protein [Acidobacteria bacterium]|nr:ABC transporter ATP-binding protein [Acidobacteriota bacterium]